MKKITIRLIVIFMTIALMSLISFQIYWLNSSYKLNKDNFDRNVHGALAKVIAKSLMGDNSAFSFKAEINGDGPFVLSATMDTVDSDKNEIKERPSTFPIMDSGAIDKTAKAFSTQLADVLESVMTLNSHMGVRDTVGYKKLDSLLIVEFRDAGIVTPFRWGVLSESIDDFVYVHYDDTDKEKLKSAFSVHDPADMIMGDKRINLYFPEKKQYLVEDMALIIVVSFIIVLIIVGVFIYSISVILKQKKLSEIKTDFINNMTHEFKTPISTVSLTIEGLLNFDLQKDDEKVRKYLDIARNENKRLGLMVEKVLKIAAHEKDELKFKFSEVNMHDIINKIENNVQVQISHKGGTFNKDLSANKVLIMADEEHITNVIYNLIDNAIKYSSDSPDLKVETKNRDDKLIIRVSDNGIGISKDQLKTIFDKFYRVPNKHVRSIKGFGLGLNYVKEIIEKHHGSITVESKEGEGSVFEVSLLLFN